jgi:hypothetical protein
LLQKNMVSLAKLLRIRQGIGEKYKNIGLEKCFGCLFDFLHFF